MATNQNYTVTFSTLLDTSTLNKQIKDVTGKARTIKLTTDSSSVKKAAEDTGQLGKALDGVNSSATDSLLTFQAANMVLRETIDIISSMVSQVFEVDAALTEFKKVTDLTGDSLTKYQKKLSGLGTSVARTGKPKGLSLSDGMVNQH